MASEFPGPDAVFKKIFGFKPFDMVKIKSLEGINLGIIVETDPVREQAKVVYFDRKRNIVILTSVHFNFMIPTKFTKRQEKRFEKALVAEIERAQK